MLIFGGIIAGVVLLLFFSNKKKEGQQRKELETKTKKTKDKGERRCIIITINR
jgi:hypothetical protein